MAIRRQRKQMVNFGRKKKRFLKYSWCNTLVLRRRWMQTISSSMTVVKCKLHILLSRCGKFILVIANWWCILCRKFSIVKFGVNIKKRDRGRQFLVSLGIYYKEATDQEFLLVKLKSSLRKFYGRHHDLAVDRYGRSVSQMTTDMFHLS